MGRLPTLFHSSLRMLTCGASPQVACISWPHDGIRTLTDAVQAERCRSADLQQGASMACPQPSSTSTSVWQAMLSCMLHVVANWCPHGRILVTGMMQGGQGFWQQSCLQA